jgi:hypothetical protein
MKGVVRLTEPMKGEEGASMAPSEHNVPKTKRRRKPKAAPNDESLFLEETSRDQPRNPLATEILDNLSKFPHCLLLTRVGQFYEV